MDFEIIPQSTGLYPRDILQTIYDWNNKRILIEDKRYFGKIGATTIVCSETYFAF